jgi:hypothetical protein
MEMRVAERLANATMEQFAYRLETAPDCLKLDKNSFYEFFRSLDLPEKACGGLILSDHKRYADYPKEFQQSYEIRDPAPVARLDITPRGVIDSHNLEGDIQRGREKPFMDRFRAELERANRRFSPKFTGGKHGKHAFLSDIQYIKMLREDKIADVLREYAKKEDRYFGFIRVDYNNLAPLERGWYKKREINWIKAFPVVIIPGIKEEHLKLIERRERRILKYSKS